MLWPGVLGGRASVGGCTVGRSGGASDGAQLGLSRRTCGPAGGAQSPGFHVCQVQAADKCQVCFRDDTVSMCCRWF